MEIGMREGKRRAIHLPVRVEVKSGGAIARSLYGDDEIARIEHAAGLEDGAYWLVVVPSTGEGDAMRLDELRAAGSSLSAKFTGGSFRSIDVRLDNRGRARNLEASADYSIRILPWKKFFEMYERRSIPVGKGRRCEPDETGKVRLRNIQEMARCNRGRALDAATGIKEYLLPIAEKCALICGNISPSMLLRTRAWLEKGAFVAYDVESGFPFKTASFDLIICDALLEYLDEPPKVLGDVARVLKKKGELLLLEPIRPLSAVRDFYPQDLWEAAVWRPMHDDAFNAAAFERTLRDGGLGVVERRAMFFEYPIYGGERFQQDIVRLSKS